MRLLRTASTIAIALASAGCATANRDEAGTATAAPAMGAQRLQVTTQLPANVRPLQYTIAAKPDAQNLRFASRVYIDIEVLEPTDTITLNAADLEIHSVSIAALGPDGRPAPAGTSTRNIGLDADKQTATFRFPERLPTGRHQLTIDYSGKINTQASGLFALDYDSPEGKKRALYTQFEAPDARRFFPGWDEPQFRTPYNLSVTVPANQMAVSNMPQAGVQNHSDGTKTVTFQQTPSMSSYLLFVAAGEFDRITATAQGGTEVGVVTKKGDGEKGRFALEAQRQLLPYYNDYFGQPFPLPKLDNVAGPGSSQFFGAMENWGAIFSFESILLVDPAITTESTRQRIFEVDAHEMAHQWFGDLVTMAWWDDLWLNEGFASWMATKATGALHPEWEPELGQVSGRESAIALDSVATTHPVVQHVETVEQISQAFDAITYQKGEAVITMLEDYVGEDAWRQGVRDYMATYKFKNTVTDNLWQKVETAAGKPITAIAHDFTLQPGVPLIRIENATCNGGTTSLTLRQGEFTRDRPNKQPLSWRVPVIAAGLGGKEARTIVTGSGTLAVPGCGPVVVNSGQSGYYRTLYTPALLDGITASFARLKPIDQIGLLADNWGLGLAGYQSASEALDLVDAVPANANPQVWTRVSSILARVYDLYEGDPQRQAMVGRYASSKLSPILARVGWSARPNEASNIAVLRSELIGTLGYFGDRQVVAEANRRFAANDPSVTAGPLRTSILAIVAENANASTWDRLHAQAKAEQNPLVKAQLYRLLGSNRDPALAQRALQLALTPEPGATTSSAIISAVAGEHPDLAFDFALQNRQAVEGLVDASSRSRYFPGLGGGSSDPAMIAKLQQYADRYLTAQSRRPADQAIASIQDRVRVRQTRLPDITRWFEAKRL
jgi:aminopeptidase N